MPRCKTRKVTNVRVREFLAELLGTFTLVIFGLSGVAQYVLGRGNHGSIHTVYWAWGVAVAMGIYVSGGVSGGHINPAVTVSLAAVGKISWRKIPQYLLGQYVGAFLAAAAVYVIYIDALNAFDGGSREVTGVNGTAGIWATYPNADVGIGNCFLDQVAGTFLLLLGICGIIDSRNTRVTGGLGPLLIGLLVFVIASTLALNCGCAINPARDLSPRLFTAIAGWGSEVFTHGNYFFWVPLIATHIGGLLGAITYVFCVEHHWPQDASGDSNDKGEGREKETLVDSKMKIEE